MPGKKHRKSKDKSPSEEQIPGMPDKDSIVEVEEFVTPEGKHYRIVKTNESDAYDEPVEDEKRDETGKHE